MKRVAVPMPKQAWPQGRPAPSQAAVRLWHKRSSPRVEFQGLLTSRLGLSFTQEAYPER